MVHNTVMAESRVALCAVKERLRRGDLGNPIRMAEAATFMELWAVRVKHQPLCFIDGAIYDSVGRIISDRLIFRARTYVQSVGVHGSLARVSFLEFCLEQLLPSPFDAVRREVIEAKSK